LIEDLQFGIEEELYLLPYVWMERDQETIEEKRRKDSIFYEPFLLLSSPSISLYPKHISNHVVD
jgi:hypothetical protein